MTEIRPLKIRWQKEERRKVVEEIRKISNPENPDTYQFAFWEAVRHEILSAIQKMKEMKP